MIVKGAFSQLFQPGLRDALLKALAEDDLLISDSIMAHKTLLDSAFMPPKENFSKDRQIEVLKTVVAGLLLSHNDHQVDVTHEMVVAAQTEYPVEIIWYPDSQKFRVRFKRG